MLRHRQGSAASRPREGQGRTVRSVGYYAAYMPYEAANMFSLYPWPYIVESNKSTTCVELPTRMGFGTLMDHLTGECAGICEPSVKT